MATLLDNVTLPHNTDEVGVLNGGEAVSDNNTCAPFLRPVQRLLHYLQVYHKDKVPQTFFIICQSQVPTALNTCIMQGLHRGYKRTVIYYLATTQISQKVTTNCLFRAVLVVPVQQ